MGAATPLLPRVLFAGAAQPCQLTMKSQRTLTVLVLARRWQGEPGPAVDTSLSRGSFAASSPYKRSQGPYRSHIAK